MQEAFRTADEVLYQATRGIYEIIARPAVVNLDFADVRTVMQGMGVALVGTGHAAGEDRAVVAARAAVASPLLEDVEIRGSQAVLVNLVGAQVTLQDTAQAMHYVQDAAGPQAHIIFGYGVDDALGDELQVTVIATGFPGHAAEPKATSAPSLAFMWRDEPAAAPAVVPEPEPAAEVVATIMPEPEPPAYEEPAFDPRTRRLRGDRRGTRTRLTAPPNRSRGRNSPRSSLAWSRSRRRRRRRPCSSRRRGPWPPPRASPSRGGGRSP